jgi:ABC-type nitrate/sulfonate/bicarbonate transport system permease component
VLALVLMIVSEFQGSTDGIGREMSITQADFDVPTMWDVIVLLGLLGITLNGVFALVERRVLAWQHGSASVSK